MNLVSVSAGEKEKKTKHDALWQIYTEKLEAYPASTWLILPDLTADSCCTRSVGLGWGSRSDRWRMEEKLRLLGG